MHSLTHVDTKMHVNRKQGTILIQIRAFFIEPRNMSYQTLDSIKIFVDTSSRTDPVKIKTKILDFQWKEEISCYQCIQRFNI